MFLIIFPVSKSNVSSILTSEVFVDSRESFDLQPLFKDPLLLEINKSEWLAKLPSLAFICDLKFCLNKFDCLPILLSKKRKTYFMQQQKKTMIFYFLLSGFIPTSKQRFKRHARHTFLVLKLISHFPLVTHICFFFSLIFLLKNPLLHKKNFYLKF